MKKRNVLAIVLAAVMATGMLAACGGKTEAPAETPAPAPSADSEYDAVPKTGQNYLYLWLLGISALSFAGSIILKKTEKHN